MNYIWGGLIILSFVFAIGHDVFDEINQTYPNGILFKGELVSLDTQTGRRVFTIGNDTIYARQKSSSGAIEEWVISDATPLPRLWENVFEALGEEEKTLRVQLHQNSVSAQLPEVHLLKLRAITAAAFDMAEIAVKLAIGLIGVMALWMGLMKIAEESRLVNALVRLVRPVLGPLFPDLPKDHPALANISLNLAANILGLGNAATPLGIKAMESLQELNVKKDEASDAMCMFLAINTSSVQLLPPVTLVALMGIQVGELMISITLATLFSTLVGVSAALFYRRVRRRHA